MSVTLGSASYSKAAKRVASIAGLVVLSLSLTACLPDRVKSVDRSGFSDYSFSQEPGLGGCFSAEVPYRVSLTQDSSGGMTVTRSDLQDAPVQGDTCENELWTEQGCMVEATQPTRPLSNAEAEGVRAAFADVKQHSNPIRECRVMGIDPCRIDAHSWGNTRLTDYVCSAPRLNDQSSAGLLAVLNAL